MTDSAPRPEPGLYQGDVHGEITDEGRSGLGRDTLSDPEAVANPEDVEDRMPADLVVTPSQPWKQPGVHVRFCGWPIFGLASLGRKGVDEDGRYRWRGLLKDDTEDSSFVSEIVVCFEGDGEFRVAVSTAPSDRPDAPWILWRGTLTVSKTEEDLP